MNNIWLQKRNRAHSDAHSDQSELLFTAGANFTQRLWSIPGLMDLTKSPFAI